LRAELDARVVDDGRENGETGRGRKLLGCLHKAPGNGREKGKERPANERKKGNLPIRRPSRIRKELLFKASTDNAIGVRCQLAMLSQKSEAELFASSRQIAVLGVVCVWQASLIRQGCQVIGLVWKV
jgi:hypothetical protein